MTRSIITSKAALATLAVCVAALVALMALAGCSSSSSASSAAASTASESASSEATSETAASSEASEASAAAETSKAGGIDDEEASVIGAKGTSSSSASSSKGSSIATGTLVDVQNKSAGYQFKTDKGYTVKFDDANTTVYTSANSGAVPYFELTLMRNSTGRSVEDFLTGVANEAIKNQGSKMVVQPVANKVKLSDRTVKGIEYVYTNDAGDKKIAVMNYVEEYSGYFFIWRTICYQTDSETPAAMEKALNTFKFMAS